jgi:predicted transglutaminase-like cysteine proteinase
MDAHFLAHEPSLIGNGGGIKILTTARHMAVANGSRPAGLNQFGHKAQDQLCGQTTRQESSGNLLEIRWSTMKKVTAKVPGIHVMHFLTDLRFLPPSRRSSLG